MNITFSVSYQTVFGEQLFLTGNHVSLGNGSLDDAIPMNYHSDGTWSIDVELKKGDQIEYSYLLKKDGQIHKVEKSIRNIKIADKPTWYKDSWSDYACFDNAFETVVFERIFKRKTSKLRTSKTTTHHFSIKVPLFEENHQLILIGNSDYLGAWEKNRGVLMTETSPHYYEVQLNLSNARTQIEYKYAIWDAKEKQIVDIELGEARALVNTRNTDSLVVIQDQVYARNEEKLWKGTGVAIPVFSLRSQESLGVGEFSDLKKMGDWAANLGMTILQILPINDTTATNTWVDSYPYAAISVYALHPLYLNLNQLEYALTAAEKKKVKTNAETLNQLKTVDYEASLNLKKEISLAVFKRNLKKIAIQKTFQTWVAENKDWLHSYAVFSVLRDELGTATFSEWGEYSTFSESLIAEFFDKKSKHFNAVWYYCFVQYQLHLQLKDSVAYLHKIGIALKGDIPIGIDRCSVDAWVAPGLYHMDMQAGAPPDAFAKKGQNWGFPTYNWDKMSEDGYDWWVKRFTKLSEYFDSFRIDHILGFFRIWQTPFHSTEGILGYFNPALPFSEDELRQKGVYSPMERLTLPYLPIESTNRLFEYNFGTLNWIFERYEDQYFFKPEFDTQRKITDLFDELPDDDHNRKIKNLLIDLHTDVILIEDVNKAGFYHPRFDLNKTNSFMHLDEGEKEILHQLGLDYFYKRHEAFWYEKGKEKLPTILNATSMLICGEDLGMVPECVPQLMKELGMLSLEIQRMPKISGTDFLQDKDIPYLSVLTPSTHDMSTLREWWEENPTLTLKYFNEVIRNYGYVPPQLTESVAEQILNKHLASSSMLSIFQLQDLMSIKSEYWSESTEDERINIPAIIPHYWRYRMPIFLEDLLKDTHFNDRLKSMFTKNRR